MGMPTSSGEEIRKRITDMKAVESWLTLNMNMLRGTIQALEVQAATISTLQSMGESFSATMGAGMPSSAQPSAAPNGAHSSSASNPGSSGNASYGANDSNAGNDPQPDEKMQGAPQPSSKDESDAASLTAPLINAAAWWSMLQDQFKQAVTGAMSTENPMSPLNPMNPLAAAAAAAEQSKAKPKAKAAPAKSASASASTSTSAAARKRKTSK